MANKIAAGEVVERPASVVKELVENSLDAAATRIDVEIVAGGCKFIAVRDNGTGMGRDDALLCIERHATSKIRTLDDIEKIATLGFRGEALAAIAAVSRFRLRTCLQGETVGTEILIVGGKLQDVREVGCPAGTEVEVRDLFLNVPARRKFLRSIQTETMQVRSLFMVMALSHPQTAVTLTVDGRMVYELAASDRYEDRVRDLFGSDYLRQLCRVEATSGPVRVFGFVSLPTFTRADRSEQYVFVNRRPTSATLVSHALREAYHALIPVDRHPCAVLFLELDPQLVDVNVHPTKKEVRFRSPGEVRDAVITAVRSALSRGGSPGGGGRTTARGDLGTQPMFGEPALKIDDLPATRTFRYPRMPTTGLGEQKDRGNAVGPIATPGTGVGTDAEKKGGVDVPKGASIEHAAAPGSPWSWCRIVGQLGGLYVLLETEDGFV
ncbi:MAG: DNA mismatch repair endonuclease MutL, partial [Kiritimatiellae bacterium]|nr:DNA mismatch repair endonuclease MutL [Kiritimatiellia bacterium]